MQFLLRSFFKTINSHHRCYLFVSYNMMLCLFNMSIDILSNQTVKYLEESVMRMRRSIYDCLSEQ